MSSEDRQRYYNTFNRSLPPTTTIDQLDKIKKDAKFKKDLAQKSLIDSIVNPIGQATLLKGLYGSKRGLKGLRSKLNTKISKPVLNAFKRVGRRVLGKKKSKVVEDILEKHANKFSENIEGGKDIQSSIQEATEGLTQDLTGEAGQEATRLFDSARSDIAQKGGDAINIVLDQVDKTIASAKSGVEGGIESAQSTVTGATETATAGLEGASAKTESAFTKFLRVGVNSGSKLSNLFGRGSSAVDSAGSNAVEMVDADLSNSVDTGAETLSRIQASLNPNDTKNADRIMSEMFGNTERGDLQSTGSELLTQAEGGGGRTLESAGSFVKGFGSIFTRSGGASRYVAPRNFSLTGEATDVYSGIRQVTPATASEIRGSLSAFNQTDADLPIVDSVIDPASLGGGSAVRTPLADLVASKVSQPIQQAVETTPTTSTEVPDLTKNITDTNFYEKDPLMEGDEPTTSTYSSSDLTQNITDTNFYEKDPLLDDVKNLGKEVLDTAEDDLAPNIEDIPEIIAGGIGETALEGGGAGVVALGEAVDTVAPEITPLSVLVDLGTIGIGAGLSLWRARAKQPDEEAPKSTTTYSSVAENIGIDE